MKIFKNSSGFTLVEILVVIAIIVILASIILYNVIQYINQGRDANIRSNLVVLVPAGELWYDRNESYADFCDSNAVENKSKPILTEQGTELVCNDSISAWAACAKFFVYPKMAYCVDSKGNQKEIDNTYCDAGITNCCVGGISNCISNQ